MKQIDKLSEWLKGAVQGGDKPKQFSHKQNAGANSSGRSGSGGGRGGSGGGRSGPKRGGFNKKRNFNNKNNQDKKMYSNSKGINSGVDSKSVGRAKIKNKGGGRPQVHKGVMRIIPIGGLEEVGKNSMVVEHENDIVVIDMGFEFPEDDLLGVDYIIPDVEYLVKRKDKIRALVITHGHLDHIGALPYVLPDLGFPPIYTSKLTAGLIKAKLKEHSLLKQTTIKLVDNKQTYRFGSLEVDFFRVNHSIPDAMGLTVRSPHGTMLHTGDFKFDFTPADGIEADIGRITHLGKRGVDVMFSDSTNAMSPGHTMSEQVVAESLERAISGASGRIIIACFASLIGRMQQIVDFAAKSGRTVFLAGRSIENNVAIAKELGFIKAPNGLIKSIKQVNSVPDEKILILTTGSQGEPLAALSRMAADSHANVKVKGGDMVVLSASPIIGNERRIAFLQDQLARLGATIVHNKIMDVHTSGHGKQEDLKMMLSLVRPVHFVPIHGTYSMRMAHRDLASGTGVDPNNIFMLDNGHVVEVQNKKAQLAKEDVGVRHVVIDGLGKGDVASNVHKEREAMSKNGVVNIVLRMKGGSLVGEPFVTTHGFVYQKEEEKIVKDIVRRSKDAISKLRKRNPRANMHDFEKFIRSEVSGLILHRLDRRPLVASIVVRG